MKQLLKKILKEIGCLGFMYRASYKLGFIAMIPSTYIRAVPICENGDPLVPLVSFGKISVFCPDEDVVLVRKTVSEKLSVASLMLPSGSKLKVLYGYRSMRVQSKFWEEACVMAKQENPNLTLREIEAIARRYSALPTGGGPHQTGGAVDVLIVDARGTSLDFGTPYRGHGDAVPMHSRSISFAQKENRRMLRNIMRKAGFVYYPGEWWHYSFGDQVWAAYTGNTCVPYGHIVP